MAIDNKSIRNSIQCFIYLFVFELSGYGFDVWTIFSKISILIQYYVHNEILSK